MPRKLPVVAAKAPPAIGPYTQAIALGDLLFVSGQIPAKSDGLIVEGGVGPQTEQCIANIKEILAAGGLGLPDVVKTTVYMTDLSQFAAMNEVYAKHFVRPFPARATVQVSALPKGALVEIEAIAAKSG